jgi:hypothetical protein
MKKTAQNDVTGDWLQSKPNSEMFEQGWDKIFGNKKEPMPHDEFVAKMLENPEVLAEYELNKSTGAVQKVETKDFPFTIPKEKHIYRMKDGVLYKLPLSNEEIIQLLKLHQWNVNDKNALSDLVDLIRAVEKVHGVV